MERILVTGGAGFIGSHLCARLADGGRRVVIVDNFDPFYDPAIKRRGYRELCETREVPLHELDIRDRDGLDALMAAERFDAVIHLAARAGVRPSIVDPELYASVNVDGTTTLLEACRRHGVRRFIFGSSSSVYGNNDKVPFAEDDAVDHPVSPYAATKRAGELLAHTYAHLHGFQIACLRLFTVYGPRQRPEMAIHKFARAIAEEAEISQYGDGDSARDYTYVSDIVDGIERALERATGFHIWNLGGARTTRLEDLIRMIGEGLGRTPKVRRLEAQPGDVERTWADVSRARDELGWSPSVPIEEGLERFLAWFRSQREGVS